jgi:Cu+-exporting ATPase
MQSITLSVPDMKCGGCVSTVQKALSETAGVQDVQVDLPSKTAEVGFDAGVTVDQLIQVVKDSGFSATPTG